MPASITEKVVITNRREVMIHPHPETCLGPVQEACSLIDLVELDFKDQSILINQSRFFQVESWRNYSGTQ